MRSTFRRHLLLAIAVAFSGAAAPLLACSGSSAFVELEPAGDAGASADGTTRDVVSSVDATVGDGNVEKDAGFLVNEEPAPVCNDLKQRGAAVQSTASPIAAPTPAPITTISPGLYVVTTIVDYGGLTVLHDSTTRTTVFFTATKQYYVNDDGAGGHQQFTLDWKVESGKLVRTILCASQPGTGTTISYRVGASANGFTVFVDNQSPGNRTETVRYERISP